MLIVPSSLVEGVGMTVTVEEDEMRNDPSEARMSESYT